jgi:hypothetical protein
MAAAMAASANGPLLLRVITTEQKVPRFNSIVPHPPDPDTGYD